MTADLDKDLETILSALEDESDPVEDRAETHYNLGVVIYESAMGDPWLYKLAAQSFTEAAELGYPKAQYNLGYMYHQGYGVEQDKETALRWFTKSAKLGNNWAQFYLGQAYRLGGILARNEKTAIVWYTRSAMKNNVEAFLYSLRRASRGIILGMHLASYNQQNS